MDKREIEDAVKIILEWKRSEEEKERHNTWVRVRCYAVGAVTVSSLWPIGYWTVTHFFPLKAAVTAFLVASGSL